LRSSKFFRELKKKGLEESTFQTSLSLSLSSECGTHFNQYSFGKFNAALEEWQVIHPSQAFHPFLVWLLIAICNLQVIEPQRESTSIRRSRCPKISGK